MSIRKLQVESTLKRAIGTILAGQLSDPRVEGMLSVTKVEVTPDFAEAFVHVSVLPAQYEKKSMYGLKHASGYIHSLVCEAVAFRVPQLTFRLDSSLKKEAKVLKAIERAKRRAIETPTETPADSATPTDASAQPTESTPKEEQP